MEEHFRSWDGEDPFCLVAEEKGEILGCIAVSFSRVFRGPRNPTGIKAEIHNFAVYETYRRRGVGKALLAAALGECRERQTGRVFLYASDMGMPIYKRFGFSCESMTCPEMRLYHDGLMGLEL